MQKVDGIVFIKKNSERLPNKNLRLFNGRPLFTIILQTLECHPMIENILIDSDSDEVLDYVSASIKKGKPINRSDYLLNPHISANDLINYDIRFSENNHFFQTHCTNPLLTKATITTAIEKYFSSLPKFDSLFSVTKIQSRFFKEDGSPLNHTNKKLDRLQDMASIFMENASFFIFSKDSFLKADNSRIGLAPQFYEISPIEGVDIDYENDFLLAELLELNKNQFPGIFRGVN